MKKIIRKLVKVENSIIRWLTALVCILFFGCCPAQAQTGCLYIHTKVISAGMNQSCRLNVSQPGMPVAGLTCVSIKQ